MADRFFPNVMPDFVAEATAETQDEEGKEPVVVTQDSLMKLLSMPYSSLSQRFKRAALDLKETVSISFTHYFLCLCVCMYEFTYSYAYQLFVDLFQITLETWGMTGQQVQDFTLYCGTLGTAFFLFRAYYSLTTTMILLSPLRLLRLVTPLLSIQGTLLTYSLALYAPNICKATDTTFYITNFTLLEWLAPSSTGHNWHSWNYYFFSTTHSWTLIIMAFLVMACSAELGCFVWCIDGRDVTFLCGRAGVCALGAVLAKHAGDEQLLNYYLVQFREVF